MCRYACNHASHVNICILWKDLLLWNATDSPKSIRHSCVVVPAFSSFAPGKLYCRDQIIKTVVGMQLGSDSWIQHSWGCLWPFSISGIKFAVLSNSVWDFLLTLTACQRRHILKYTDLTNRKFRNGEVSWTPLLHSYSMLILFSLAIDNWREAEVVVTVPLLLCFAFFKWSFAALCSWRT